MLRKVLYCVGLALVIVALVLGGLASKNYFDRQRRKDQIAEAVTKGQIEIYRASTTWNVEKDYQLDATIWIKNNNTHDVAGTWVFRLILDHARLEEAFLEKLSGSIQRTTCCRQSKRERAVIT